MHDTIVFTGATSGFGAAALKIITERSDVPIIVGARNPNVVSDKYGDRVQSIPLDLSSLKSLEGFLAAFPQQLSIGALVMNAGLTLAKPSMSEDGIETTFQVNYLSHFMMYKALEKQLTPEAVVLTTGSGTHDPKEKTPIPPPRYTDVEILADLAKLPKRDRIPMRAAGRAYSTSKLCCILMAEHIAQRRPDGMSNSFDPGFLPDTQLAREAPKAAFAIAKRVIPLLLSNKDRTGSIDTTAPCFADMILSENNPAKNGDYVAVRGGKLIAVETSELAQTPGLSKKLWDQTEAFLEKIR